MQHFSAPIFSETEADPRPEFSATTGEVVHSSSSSGGVNMLVCMYIWFYVCLCCVVVLLHIDQFSFWWLQVCLSKFSSVLFCSANPVGQIEHCKGVEGEENGEGSPLQPIRGLESVVLRKLPQRGSGQSLAENGFGTFSAWKNIWWQQIVWSMGACPLSPLAMPLMVDLLLKEWEVIIIWFD